MNNYKKIKYNKLYIHEITYSDIIKEIHDSIKFKKNITITYFNVYVANYTNKDSSLSEVINKFNIVYPDGIGIYLFSKIILGKNGFKKRINATDLNYLILNEAIKNNWKIFFYGGGIESHYKLTNTLKTKYNDLNISGICHKYENIENTLNKINESNPHLLFIGLGTPVQEKFIIEKLINLKIPAIISVGSFLEFLSEYRKRAPQWMRKIGLEWLFRLFQEPKRLWKRYIFGIPIFIFYVLRQKVKLIIKKTEE